MWDLVASAQMVDVEWRKTVIPFTPHHDRYASCIFQDHAITLVRNETASTAPAGVHAQ